MKNLFVNSFLLLASCFIIYSCASNKGLSKNYYSNPNKEITKKTGISETKRAVREVDRLASQATDKLRAVGVGNDYDEKYARREAIRDAQTILAEYIENAIVEVVKEYNKNVKLNRDMVSERNIEGVVISTVAQKINSVPVGLPEVYDLSDGTVRVYVCVELKSKTEDLLGETYDNLTKEQILGVDYDKQKFINDNIDTIKKLQNKLE